MDMALETRNVDERLREAIRAVAHASAIRRRADPATDGYRAAAADERRALEQLREMAKPPRRR
jgi:hypothetical protein